MVLVFWQISDHKDFASILEDEKRHRALRDEKKVGRMGDGKSPQRCSGRFCVLS